MSLIKHAHAAKHSTPLPPSESKPKKKSDSRPSGGGGGTSSFTAASARRVEIDPPPPPRRKEQALSDAEKLLNPPATGKAPNGAQIIKDPPNVNDPSHTDPKSTTYQVASMQVAANAGLEAEALKPLPADDQKRYQDVKTKLSNDPVAQLSLQTMLLRGELPGEKSSGGDHGNVLQQLDAMANQTPAAGLGEADQLLASTVKEIATPSAINQGAKGTCVATSCGIALAKSNPAEYVRLLSGLASEKGEVLCADGKTTLRREPETLGSDSSGRAVTQRLLGPALMEVGNGWRDYRDDLDHTEGGVLPDQYGLLVFNGDADRIFEALTGRDFTCFGTITTSVGLGWSNANTVIDQFKSGNTPILIAMEYPGWNDGHAALVDNVETVDGTTYITYTNPWGQTERMNYDEFAAKIRGASYPAPPSDPSSEPPAPQGA